MKISLSNIALPPYEHTAELATLSSLGISGLEIAPSRVWQETGHGLTPRDVAAYRRQVEEAGLRVVGLHSLLFDQPELSLFTGPDARARLRDFFVHLSAVCRDLGGRTLIWGGGRRRGDVPEQKAFEVAVSFIEDLLPRIHDHGTCFCFEPLGPTDSDFINSAYDSLRIVEHIHHASFRVQLDAKALAENTEVKREVFEAVRPYLVHFHANEPGLGILGTSGKVDHSSLGRFLRDIEYDGYVSIEQKMLDGHDPIDAISKSAKILLNCYA